MRWPIIIIVAGAVGRGTTVIAGWCGAGHDLAMAFGIAAFATQAAILTFFWTIKPKW